MMRSYEGVMVEKATTKGGILLTFRGNKECGVSRVTPSRKLKPLRKIREGSTLEKKIEQKTQTKTGVVFGEDIPDRGRKERGRKWCEGAKYQVVKGESHGGNAGAPVQVSAPKSSRLNLY